MHWMDWDENDDVKRWNQSRTVWVGILEIAIGVAGLVADHLASGQEWTPASIVLIVAGGLTLVLRKITTKPLGKG